MMILLQFIIAVEFLLYNYKMMENVTKSIIYGNIYENRYGKFLPVCSSISDRGNFGINQLRFNRYWIIFMIPLTLKSTIELHMPTEFSKLP